MTDTISNKFRAAAEVLLRGQERLVDSLADEVLDRSDDLLESGYLFHELLENQGTRIHFLSLLVSQLEHSADELDERRAAAAATAQRKAARARKARSRRKPISDQQRPAHGKAARDRESPPEES